MAEFDNYYEILGISPGASPDEIRRAYLDKCFILHPDRMSNLPESARKLAEKELVKVNQAYDVLKDPYKRQAYVDRWFNKKARPKPDVKPSHILFGTLEPGQTKRTKFTIENSGGSYSQLWFSNPDSWLKVISWHSLSGEELPLEVEIEATAPDWGETRNESIQVRLDDEETGVEVTLEVRPGPSAEAAPKPKQEWFPKSKPPSSPKHHGIPRQRIIVYIACAAVIVLAAILLPIINIPSLANGLDISVNQSNRIACISSNGGNKTLNLINPDGRGQIELQQSSTVYAPEIKWSPDGSYIFHYSAAGQDEDGQIIIINADSNNKKRYSLKGMSPVWSSTGKKIMFSSDKEANRQLYIMDAAGTGMMRISSELQGIMGLSTAWSSGDQKALYLARSDRGIDIFETSISGTDRKRITGYAITEIGQFKWSPDGLKLAFTADANDLFVMNADGKNRKKISANGLFGDYLWSPDGNMLAYCSYSAENSGKMDIHIANLETNESFRLIDSDPNTDLIFTWSQDSRRLAFVSLSLDASDIYSVNCDGSGISQLTANSGYNAFPAWSADGKKIAYSHASVRDYDHIESEIFIMSSDGSNKTQLCPGYYPLWSPR